MSGVHAHVRRGACLQVFSYAAAAVLFLAVEKPMSNVELVLIAAFDMWRSRTASLAAQKASDASDAGSFTPKAASRPVIISRDDRASLLSGSDLR